ncbi:MAG: ATP-dependent helicase/nuclease subunit B, partial [Flavobacteriales bacterium]
MHTFLEETIQYLTKKHGSLSDLTIVLPSKRAGGVLLNYLKNDAHSTSFAPKIISIETFIENVS